MKFYYVRPWHWWLLAAVVFGLLDLMPVAILCIFFAFFDRQTEKEGQP